MKKYITKTVLALTTSVIAFMFIFSPMMSSAKEYSLTKTKHLSYSTESFDASILVKYSTTEHFSHVALAPVRTSGMSQYAHTVCSDPTYVCDLENNEIYWINAKVEYRNMSQTFYTNSAKYEWIFYKDSQTLK